MPLYRENRSAHRYSPRLSRAASDWRSASAICRAATSAKPSTPSGAATASNRFAMSSMAARRAGGFFRASQHAESRWVTLSACSASVPGADSTAQRRLGFSFNMFSTCLRQSAFAVELPPNLDTTIGIYITSIAAVRAAAESLPESVKRPIKKRALSLYTMCDARIGACASVQKETELQYIIKNT